MTLTTKTRCRSCNAEISFGLTAKGKRMPLDTDEVDAMSLAVSLTAGDAGLRGLQTFIDRSRIRQATLDDVTAGQAIYRPHFATCPNAASHRSR